MGTPLAPHSGFLSNVAAFVLAPVLAPPPSFTHTSVDPQTNLITGKITVTFAPKVAKRQRVQLILNEFQPPATRPPRGYIFNAPKDNGIPAAQQETDKIDFVVKDVAGGDYLVRAVVDGGENVLERDTNIASPTFNEFIGPKVTVQ
jgi:hypothetical protein